MVWNCHPLGFMCTSRTISQMRFSRLGFCRYFRINVICIIFSFGIVPRRRRFTALCYRICFDRGENRIGVNCFLAFSRLRLAILLLIKMGPRAFRVINRILPSGLNSIWLFRQLFSKVSPRNFNILPKQQNSLAFDWYELSFIVVFTVVLSRGRSPRIDAAPRYYCSNRYVY